MTDLSREELLNRCHEKIQICCKLYYDTCRGTEEEKRCTQWGNQIRILIQMKKKVFEIINCNSDCPLRQTPAYDSSWCNFHGEDLDNFNWTSKNRKPRFCKVKRVIVEEQ